MTAPDDHAHGAPLRYHHDSPEFHRVVALSDGVFAIALTLLVLTLDIPDVSADQLGRALLAEGQQVVIFVLSFVLVANIWWFHHKLIAVLAVFETGMIAMNLALLGLVALVPFPTNLVGNTPTARAAVWSLLAVFLAISVVFLAMVLRAHLAQAWRRPPPDGTFTWLVTGWLGQLAGMSIAMLVTVWAPIAGLVVAALTGTVVGVVMGVVAPSPYRGWKGRPGL